MRSDVSRVERWRALGRLLPRDVRERIFDPAFSDLVYTWLNSADGPRRVAFGVKAMSTYVACFPIAIPRLFVRRGRLTRFGRLSVWAFAVICTVALAVVNIANSYASYPQ